MLHITNGDSVVFGFRDGQIPGTYLPWRDVLHDGPVPLTESLEKLSDIRARVVSSPEDFPEVRASFAERDRTLADFRAHDETVLWFEHDLYDQLQLLQILDWLSGQDRGGARISLIQIGTHPEVSPFFGLGQLTGRQLAELLPRRQPVTQGQFAIGREGWAAFRAPDPSALAGLATGSFPEMPFLAAAVRRCLEEYPSADSGLSRLERQLLEAGASGARHRHDYFLESNRRDDCPWGDLTVYDRLGGLASGPTPALDRVSADEFALNDRGRRLLAGDEDWCDFREPAEMWIGGVRWDSRHPRWRWDHTRHALVATK